MIHTFLILGLCSLILCLALTPACRDLFQRFGLVDRADTERKFHLREVPRIGGLPIVLSYTGTLLIFLLLHPGGTRIYIQHKALYRELLPAAGLIFLTGLIDDIFGLKPWQKLTGQFIASFLAVSLGARLAFVHIPPWASFTLSLVWLLGCTNAFNLIDGMDGLATGVSLIASLTTATIAVLTRNTGLAIATIPLAGSLLGFLRYNFSPASIFLGDCGSLTIGFMLGCFSLVWSQHTSNLLGVAAPLMVLSLPLLDVMLAICRRFLRSAPIFQGDRGHIHHMILGMGFSTRNAALILYMVCCLSASLGLLAAFGDISFCLITLVVFCLLIFIGIYRLDYVEWRAVSRILAETNMRRAVQGEILLVELRRSLLCADSVDDFWRIIQHLCAELHFASARLDLLGFSYTEQFVDPSDAPHVRIQIHFGSGDYLVLTRGYGSKPSRVMMPALNYLQESLIERTAMRTIERASVRTNAA